MTTRSVARNEGKFWFYLVAQNDEARDALQISQRHRCHLAHLEVPKPTKTSRNLGHLGVPISRWKSRDEDDPSNVLTFGTRESCDIILRSGAPLQARLVLNHNRALLLRDESDAETTFAMRTSLPRDFYSFSLEKGDRQRVIIESAETYLALDMAHFTLDFVHDPIWWTRHESTKRKLLENAKATLTGANIVPQVASSASANRKRAVYRMQKADAEACWLSWVSGVMGRASQPTARSFEEYEEYKTFVRPLEPIAEGQFGAVHRVIDFRTGQISARKVMDLEKHGPVAAQELRNIKALREDHAIHTNIVKFYYCKNFGDYLYIHMKPARYSVRDFIKSREAGQPALSKDDAQFFARQVLSGLHHVHCKLNMVHRDLNPNNILIDEAEPTAHPVKTYLLADFGLSKRVEQVSNSTVGTKFYMAPEIVDMDIFSSTGQETKQTPAVDIWAFGVTLLELLLPDRREFGPVAKSNTDLIIWCGFVSTRCHLSIFRNIVAFEPGHRLPAKQIAKTLDLLSGEQNIPRISRKDLHEYSRTHNGRKHPDSGAHRPDNQMITQSNGALTTQCEYIPLVTVSGVKRSASPNTQGRSIKARTDGNSSTVSEDLSTDGQAEWTSAATDATAFSHTDFTMEDTSKQATPKASALPAWPDLPLGKGWGVYKV